MSRYLRFRKRTSVSALRRVMTPVISVLAALAFCALFLALMGHEPIAVYGKMISTVGSTGGLSRSVEAGIPLMLTGLAVTFGYRMNLNNIGADGQYALGALLCAGFALFGPVMPPVFKILCMFVIAMLGGALAALIAAFPKAQWGVNETILTMMLNYVFLYAMDYLVYGPWKEPGQMVAQTKAIKEKYWLPDLGSTGVSSVLVIVLLIAVLMYLFHTKTKWGYKMEVIRQNPRAAQYAGMSVRTATLLTLCMSGAIAGLAGFAQVAGILHRVQANLPDGAGYTGIVIAFLAGLNPLVVPLVGFFFGARQISSVAVQLTGVPSQVSTMIQGSIMLFVVAGEFFNRYEFAGVKSKERA